MQCVYMAKSDVINKNRTYQGMILMAFDGFHKLRMRASTRVHWHNRENSLLLHWGRCAAREEYLEHCFRLTQLNDDRGSERWHVKQ